MEQDKAYTVRFLREALEDMTEIISSFVMLGSKQGARRIRKKSTRQSVRSEFFLIRVPLFPTQSLPEAVSE